MNRGGRSRSPSYSPPRQRHFSPVRNSHYNTADQSRSPSYSPPRQRTFPIASNDGGVSPPRVGPVYSNGRSRSRSGDQKYPRGIKTRRSRSRSMDRKVRKRSRSRSMSPKFKPGVGSSYPWQDQETLRTLECKDCDVRLHDRDSMISHLRGRPHLMQQKRLRDNEVRMGTMWEKGLDDVLKPDKESLNYDDSFWDRERGPRKLRPEQERFLDTRRLDMIKPKFDPKGYDYGQFRHKEEEMHCEVCDVWTKSRDIMQAHKEGINHKKKSAKVQRFQCTLCLIEVPCQDTLDNHMRGKDHIKREKEKQEQRRKGVAGGEDYEYEDVGYKTGPREMANLVTDSEREELEQLRYRVKVLQEKVKEYQKDKANCVRDHGKLEVKELREKVQWCQEVHIRPKEFERRGIFCKKEEMESDQPSTSQRVKEEKGMVKREQFQGREFDTEYMEGCNDGQGRVKREQFKNEKPSTAYEG